MRNLIFSLLALCLLTPNLFSQNERTVLVEHFTQASCPPCASYNPGFQATLDANASFIAPIRDQTQFPGFDPMYFENTSDVNIRNNFYTPNGVPTPVLQGVPDAPISNTSLNNAYNNPSPFIINVSAVLSNVLGSTPADFPQLNDDTTIDIEMEIIASSAVSGNLRAFIVVIEEEINYASPPGSNGETDFFNVMRKMLPTGNGTALSNFSSGSTTTINQSWNVESYIKDVSQLAVVAFIQDVNTREVYQAALEKPIASESPFTTNVNLVSIESVPLSCETVFTPQIVIQNLGNQTLNALDIEYSINGITQNYTWTGNLLTWAEELVTLPEANTTTGNNFLDVSLNINNDEDTSNNSANLNFETAKISNVPDITLNLTLDNYGSETTWTIRDENGFDIATGGPYSENTNGTQITINESLENGCYSFIINDAFGDGICCSYGNGSYNIINSEGETLVSGGQFGSSETVPFIIDVCQVEVRTRVFLEGTYNSQTGLMTTDLANVNLIPANQTYSRPPYNYFGNESVTTNIPNIVDWVLLEARTSISATTVVEQQAGLLRNDGLVVNTDGNIGICFSNLNPDEAYYLVVRHRNHLDIMSREPIAFANIQGYDFTNAVSQVYGQNQTKTFDDGKIGLLAGDFTGDAIFNFADFNTYSPLLNTTNQYSEVDANLDGAITIDDFNLYRSNLNIIGINEVRY